MHRSSQFLRQCHLTQIANRVTKPCDVFINHRGIDTKRTVATLLYDHLSRLKLHPFLDNKNMKPGDKNWSDVVTSASDIVIKTLLEIESEKQMQRRKGTPILHV
ncbi:hypothetical protein D5086_021973 [Populus alba]|uniref:Uncharacterized protein n=1 Tax=Populus alba TaxID=43335 RepID=A0ACC4BDU6_POPAL